MAPNQIVLSLGIVVILVGLCAWFFRPPAPTAKNKIKFHEFEVTLNTPAFVIVAFGIVLIIASAWLARCPPGSSVDEGNTYSHNMIAVWDPAGKSCEINNTIKDNGMGITRGPLQSPDKPK